MKERLRKTGLCLFCGIIFALCIFFSAGMFLPGLSYAAEGSERPHLVRDNRVSSTFGEELEVWFSRNFACRSSVVDCFSHLRETLFSTGNDQVIVGRDGFLFFRETEADFCGTAPMTEEELDAAADVLLTMQTYSEANGAVFLFLCAPNKNTVYPEKMPGRYFRSDSPSDLDRLYERLDARSIRYLDVRDLLRGEEELVYHKRDTHWNAIGARLVYDALMAHLGLMGSAEQNGTALTTASFSGDLDSLLYPGNPTVEEILLYDNAGRFVYTSAFSTPMDMIITSRSDGKNGSLLMFRDSFGNALLEDLAVGFGEAHFERAVPYRLELLKNGAYDVVLVELAERNLRTLIGADARIPKE